MPIVTGGRTGTSECCTEAAKVQLTGFHLVDDGIEFIGVNVQDAVDELASGRVVEESMGVRCGQVGKGLPQDGDGQCFAEGERRHIVAGITRIVFVGV